MIYLILVLLGLTFGSFVNALVWRLHEKEQRAESAESEKEESRNKPSSQPLALNSDELSIWKGRSMCPNCRHALAGKDLVPVLSWVELRGRCRYCSQKISWQYPLVELLTAGLFTASYIWWPTSFNTQGIINFSLWLAVIVGFVALTVYDFRWMTLPNKIIFPLIGITAVVEAVNLVFYGGTAHDVAQLILAIVIASGFFYLIYQVSKGAWIGGGDIKLGFLIGLLLPTAWLAYLTLFFASLVGSAAILPGLMLSKKITRTSHIPFGPFLIISTIIVKLFGVSIIDYYKNKYLLY